MKQNLAGRILGKIKIFVQDFVTIKTGVIDSKYFGKLCALMTIYGWYSDSRIMQFMIFDVREIPSNKSSQRD